MTAGRRGIGSFHLCYRNEKRATDLRMVALIFKRCYALGGRFGFLPRRTEPGIGAFARMGITIPEELLAEFDRL